MDRFILSVFTWERKLMQHVDFNCFLSKSVPATIRLVHVLIPLNPYLSEVFQWHLFLWFCWIVPIQAYSADWHAYWSPYHSCSLTKPICTGVKTGFSLTSKFTCNTYCVHNFVFRRLIAGILQRIIIKVYGLDIKWWLQACYTYSVFF